MTTDVPTAAGTLALPPSPVVQSPGVSAGCSAQARTWRVWGRVHFQAHSGCGQGSVPRSCGTELPTSRLAISPVVVLCFERPRPLLGSWTPSSVFQASNRRSSPHDLDPSDPSSPSFLLLHLSDVSQRGASAPADSRD